MQSMVHDQIAAGILVFAVLWACKVAFVRSFLSGKRWILSEENAQSAFQK